MDFWKDLSENEELKAELKAEFSKEDAAAGKDDLIRKIDIIAEFARKKGYPFEDEDLELAKAKAVKMELSDEELEKIAGGASEQEMKQYCFADYLCALVWNHCVVSNECSDGLWMCDSAVSQGDCNRAMEASKDCSGLFL